jgi:hypothetical protein
MKNEVLGNGPRSQLGAKANPNIVGSKLCQSKHRGLHVVSNPFLLDFKDIIKVNT